MVPQVCVPVLDHSSWWFTSLGVDLLQSKQEIGSLASRDTTYDWVMLAWPWLVACCLPPLSWTIIEDCWLSWMTYQPSMMMTYDDDRWCFNSCAFSRFQGLKWIFHHVHWLSSTIYTYLTKTVIITVVYPWINTNYSHNHPHKPHDCFNFWVKKISW